ncbi:MAG: cobalamin-binding protein [Deltaproteobacteria bacterium]|nr:cobalamin-binding protein [Deltaproteobacteria bacterium]
MENELSKKLGDLLEDEVLNLVQERLDRGGDPMQILADCQQGVQIVGKKFEDGQYYISDLIMAGEIFKQINTKLADKLSGDFGPSLGKVVVGTVKDDIHDIGKDLVVQMLRASNFDVTDLGVDVPAEKFVQAVQDTGAKVVGLSCLLTFGYDSIKATIEALEKAGLRPSVKVIIGGGPIDEKVKEYTGADAWGADPQSAVKQTSQWMEVDHG